MSLLMASEITVSYDSATDRECHRKFDPQIDNPSHWKSQTCRISLMSKVPDTNLSFEPIVTSPSQFCCY